MTTSTLPIILCGKSGKMGQAIVSAVQSQPGMEIVGATSRHEPLAGILLSLPASLTATSVIVDFSHTSLTTSHLSEAIKHKIPYVLGCTGLSPNAKAALQDAASHIPVFYAPNFSLGAAVMKWLAVRASTLLPTADIVIQDIHHKEKKDAPSGTALGLKEAMLETLRLASNGGQPPENAIQTVSVRAGTIFGEHTVSFMLHGESLEVTHKAESRSIFAHGALKAAQFIKVHPPGLYGMENMLGIR